MNRKMRSMTEGQPEQEESANPRSGATNMKTNYEVEAKGLEGAANGVKNALPIKPPKEELRALSQINPLMSVYHITLEWVLIIAAVALCRRHWSPWLYV